MKTSLITSLLLFLSFEAGASQPSIKACTARQMVQLEESIVEQAQEYDHSEARMLLNSQNQVVGYFAWSSNGLSIHGELCEVLEADGETTVASSWYYWNEDYTVSANPATWSVGVEYGMSQDEGLASMTVLSADANGDLSLDFKVLGWQGDAEEVSVIRSEVLRLLK